MNIHNGGIIKIVSLPSRNTSGSAVTQVLYFSVMSIICYSFLVNVTCIFLKCVFQYIAVIIDVFHYIPNYCIYIGELLDLEEAKISFL